MENGESTDSQQNHVANIRIDRGEEHSFQVKDWVGNGGREDKVAEKCMERTFLYLVPFPLFLFKMPSNTHKSA